MPRPRKSRAAEPSALYEVQVRVGRRQRTARMDPLQLEIARAARLLGGEAELSRHLGVDGSEPARWLREIGTPPADVRRQLQDLTYVAARLEDLWPDDDIAAMWMQSSNAFLDGARPIDVLRLEGPGPVVAAIDAAIAGSFA